MEGDGEAEKEQCCTPSQAFAAFGGSLRKRSIPTATSNSDKKEKETPKAVKEVAKAAPKKKTTFTWQPANQTPKAKDDDDSKENISTSDDIVCDSSVEITSKDTCNPDEHNQDDDVVVDENNGLSKPDDVDDNKPIDASQGSNCSMDEDNSQSSQQIDANGVDPTEQCDEKTSSPSPVPCDGLDANANPEQDIPEEDWNNVNIQTEEADVPLPSPPPTPPPFEDTKVEDVEEPFTEEQNEEPPAPAYSDLDADDHTKVGDGVEPFMEEQIEEPPAPASCDADEQDVVVEEDMQDDTEAPPRPSPPTPPQPPVHQVNHQNGPADDPRLRHDGHMQQSAAPSPPSVPAEPPAVPRAPPAPPAPPAAPPAPPVPSGGPPSPPQSNSAPPAPPGAPPAPPGPPPPPGGGGAGGPPPPPPPPPPPGPGGPGGAGGGGGGNDLASQIAAAKLKKASAAPKPEGEEPQKRAGGPGGVNMMADLQRKLQMRKQKAEGGDSGASSAPSANKERKSPPEQRSEPQKNSRPWEKKITNGAIAPGSPRTRSSINNKENGSAGGDNVDFEKMKQEIMVEMRKEISKMKEDIIAAIKMELNRR
ncbi:uncharacterized protein [Amphiura filiformis]|uniref:uncharacterized protein isoform X2 n=1 Tax=Amphiura filiformis TaxID=82378 RepID=UPI003B22646D